MNRKTEKILYWAPRVLALLVAGFFSLFSFDVFGEGYTFWQSLLAFSIHISPAAIIFLFLLIAWRRELIGALLFLSLAFLYLYFSWSRFRIGVLLAVNFPLLLTSILFFINWKLKRGELINIGKKIVNSK